ncbi:MAG: phospholipid carrier-dependent glycosyltransferase, partial [Ignavibacteria bacterium]|nr:phospholipid carrier-dependent glycosyltransferase [Ignavibacteria bacterium]
SEIVYRTGEALADSLKFSIQDIKHWKGFGVAEGKDENLYSIFGPMQSITVVPLIKLAELINLTGWYKNISNLIPISFHQSEFIDFRNIARPKDIKPHAERFLVSFFNSIVSAFIVYIFWLIMLAFGISKLSAFIVSLLLGLGTIVWHYATTFFSEPLALLFVLISFYLLIKNDERFNQEIKLKQIFYSGIFLGLSISTHVSSILFAPFFAFYSFNLIKINNYTLKKLRPLFYFSFGLLIILFLLGVYNYLRFGDFFETGRYLNPDFKKFGYGTFVEPWLGLYGLTLGFGKGLIFYSPLILFSIFLWKKFHKHYPLLSYVIIAMIITRIIFIASRSDWHGGYSLGPRYLYLIIPFFLFPIALWLNEVFKQKKKLNFVLFVFLSFLVISQQIYFNVGEIFSYYHILTNIFLSHAVNVHEFQRIYLDLNISPILYLLKGLRGPFLFQSLHISNFQLWIYISLFIGFIIFVFSSIILKKQFTSKDTLINPEVKSNSTIES